ncbi:MAG TPA: phosphotransferase [Microlunatus sp.]
MTAEERQLLDSAMVAASALSGTSLTVVGEPFSGGNRSVVVRARRSDTQETVVVKGYDAGRAGEAWAREAAALTALAGLPTGTPALVAATASPPVVVMEDLGPGDSVATALLAADPLAAEHAVVDWAEALADLHAATWNNVARFEAALSDLGGLTPPNPRAMPDVLTDGVDRLRRAAEPLGIEVSEQVTDEIVAIAARLDDEVQVLSPFDACPDNNIRTATGLRLIDFEGATVAHPAWDVAYLRVPWPSCWCAWRMPDAVAERAQQAWQDRLHTGVAHRGVEPDRAAVDAAIQLASLVWCLVTVGWFLPGALADRRAGGGDLSSPPLPAVVQHRLGLVADSDVADLGASRDLARQLAAALPFERQSHQLPIAPAFRP